MVVLFLRRCFGRISKKKKKTPRTLHPARHAFFFQYDRGTRADNTFVHLFCFFFVFFKTRQTRVLSGVSFFFFLRDSSRKLASVRKDFPFFSPSKTINLSFPSTTSDSLAIDRSFASRTVRRPSLSVHFFQHRPALYVLFSVTQVNRSSPLFELPIA